MFEAPYPICFENNTSIKLETGTPICLPLRVVCSKEDFQREKDLMKKYQVPYLGPESSFVGSIATAG